MFFYRNPMWGIGFRIFMVIMLIAGGTFMARSAFQAGFVQGAAVEGGEITAPFFYPHMRGYQPMGGSFLSFLAIFFGGILLIKMITSIVGLVMFKRWKGEGGPDWDEMKARKYRNFRHPHHFGPCHPGPWGTYHMKDEPGAEADTPDEGEEEAS
jgi:hypothetical protein